MHRSLLALACTATLACRGTPAAVAPSAPSPPVAHETHCPVPAVLVARAKADVAAILDADPLAKSVTWKRASSGEALTAHDGTVFTIDEGAHDDLVAKAGSAVRWRAAGFDIAGGGLWVGLSPRESIVTRSWSRGNTELFDAKDGRKIAEVGNDVPIDPYDRYVLDVPVMQFGVETLDHPDVRVVALPSGKTTSLDLPAATDSPSFKAAICSTGATFALLYAGTLAVYDATTLTRVASAEGEGLNLQFTSSGRFLATEDFEGHVLGLYELR